MVRLAGDPAAGWLPTASCPAGAYLILGGDEVYPVGSPREYESRFIGPYKAALPWTSTEHPCMLAIPGNHDWYDGLTGFMRVFGQERWIGGWQTRQRRSYFAVGCRSGWWLWGIDIQFDTYIDAPSSTTSRRPRRFMERATG